MEEVGVYGSFILIRIVDSGNRTRCDFLHLRGVVSGAGHFVDAAGGYSVVDTYRSFFQAGTWERCVTSRTKCPTRLVVIVR